MRRIFILHIIILLNLSGIRAQLAPLQDQYRMNGLAINPAYAGSDDALSISLLYRNQWVGFEGAPVTSTLSVHSPLKRETIALGFLLMYDKIGIERNTLFIGNYAYRIISPRGVFSLGLSAGLRLQNEALQDLRKIDLDDQVLPVSSRTYVLPDFNLGFFYRNDRYRAGLSVVSLLGYKVNTTKGGYHLNLSLRETNYMIYGEYLYSRIEGITLNPGALLKVNPANAYQVDLNLNVIFRERFWLGAGYRSTGGIIWMFQFMANDQARIAYSYDMDFSPLGSYHRGSHEIILKYVFKYFVEAVDPRQF